jgi:hypothetical protein
MPWYYNSGNVARPVQVKPGLTVSVRPHTKVEIVKMTPEAQALIRKGIFRRTGKPRGSKPVGDVKKDEPKIEDVVEKSPMAKNIAEKGKTSSKRKPPKPAKGKTVEMTEGEEMGSKKGADLADGLSKVAVDKKDEKEKTDKK